MMNYGSFVISLDFELFWGVRDLKNAQEYRNSILGAKEVIPKMVELFKKYEVKATFAIVGLLLCNSKEDILKYIPSKKPTYKNKKLSPFENGYIDNLLPNDYSLHFAPDIVDYLKQQSNIEIGTHTFSHYYCMADGQTVDEFEADLYSAITIAKMYNINLSSIIFPRNEVNDEYLKICAQYNIFNYRGNPPKFFNDKSSKNKLLRILDTYFNYGNNTTYGYDEIIQNNMYNIKASRFLRPYSQKLSLLENMKIRRIKKEMKEAAINNRVYHLWWHPCNFGINQEQNLDMLENILQYYFILNKKYGMQSYTMKSMSNLLKMK